MVSPILEADLYAFFLTLALGTLFRENKGWVVANYRSYGPGIYLLPPTVLTFDGLQRPTLLQTYLRSNRTSACALYTPSAASVSNSGVSVKP